MTARKAHTRKKSVTSVTRLPRFNSALGKFLALPPHLEQTYSDVVTQVYPLKASMTRLQEFCESYLSLSENPPFSFKPAAPWVLMQVCDYGRIASTTSNIGWVSQHELAFGLPVEWYKKEGSKWVFADWAMIYPFIFVDNPLSMSAGREIYGWAKSGIRIDPVAPIFEPGNSQCVLSISLAKSGTSPGEPSATREFLQIFQRRSFLSSKSAATDLFSAIPKAIAGTVAAAYSLYEMAGVRPFGFADRDQQSVEAMISKYYGGLRMLLPEAIRAKQSRGRGATAQDEQSRMPPLNIITLKQVRDVRTASSACFQAVVGSKMYVEKVADGGYLFDPASGDLSGGISINLLNSDMQPIVKALGIETSEFSTVGGHPASVLRSLMPFWLKMDLRYGLADYQCWRTDTTGWTLGDSPTLLAHRDIPYLTSGSGAQEEVGGPYDYPQVTMRVLPLRADTRKLRGLIREYLRNDVYEFEIASELSGAGSESVVCLIARNFEDMEAATNPGVHYSDQDVTFALPILWRARGRAKTSWRPALIPLYAFTGTDWNAVTNYEVHGWLAFKSTLETPAIAWLKDASPTNTDRKLLLTVKTDLFPEPNAGQVAQEMTVLEFTSGDEAPASRVPMMNHLDQLGLKHLWTGEIFHSIALKQVRDARDGERADYQALIGMERRFKRVRGTQEEPAIRPLPPVEIRAYEYSGLSIVQMLGLKSERRDDSGPYPAYKLKSVNPFWLSGSMHGDAGHEMCWRVGRGGWRRNPEFEAASANRKRDSRAKAPTLKRTKKKK